MGGGLELLWWGVKHDDAETGGLERGNMPRCHGAVWTWPIFFLLFSFFLSQFGTRVVVGAKEQGTKLS